MTVWANISQIKSSKISSNRESSCTIKSCYFRVDFQESTPDVRNSKVEDIIKRLRDYNIEPLVVDPWADVDEAKSEYGVEIVDLSEVKAADSLVFTVVTQSSLSYPLKK